ncbi:hypothetical protein SLEP1_g1562 [Rubroshorea leprosula]|uniref:Uncharacterized protein n=1 Tax=Rubroshorea leprosula TaxID=152421 RepID=A0AAV5HE61_9ROSI|nr:hypothetical protein SLEP1_g1562 [Rubroshorea leprosula]
MEGGSSSSSKKKRKDISQIDEDDGNEEEKIEKFFALIKSIREARERLTINGSTISDVGKKMKLEEPSFRREDFIEPAPAKELAPVGLVAFAESTRDGTDKDKKGKEGLDLSLSL